MNNLTNQILSTIADGYDSIRPGLGDCVREAMSQPATSATSPAASIRQQSPPYTQEGERIEPRYHSFVPRMDITTRKAVDACAVCGNARGTVYHDSAKRHPLDFTIAQLAAIRQAVLEVIDDEHWDMWEGSRIEPGEVKVSISEDQANEARLDFCDAVQRTLKDMVWDEQNSKEQAK